VLGTNDAEGSITRVDKHIDNIVGAIEKKNIALMAALRQQGTGHPGPRTRRHVAEPVREHLGALHHQHARRRDVRAPSMSGASSS
jgi:hypothetical protein